MKYLSYFVLASLFVILSCSENNDTIESEDLTLNDFPQAWKLMKMTGSFTGSESVGQEMEWQENYVFKSDGTFLKNRITGGESESASGSYIFDSEDQDFVLNYDLINGIIGSCYSGGTKEYLYFNEDSKILLSEWWACDGPGLFYERINK